MATEDEAYLPMRVQVNPEKLRAFQAAQRTVHNLSIDLKDALGKLQKASDDLANGFIVSNETLSDESPAED